jgi:hypothetical protein
VSDGWGALATLQPDGISRERWVELYSAVATAAGAAGPVYERYGGSVTLRNAAYIRTNVNLLANWELSIRDPEQLPVHSLISAVESAVARARQLADEAAEREKGLTGMIAAFLRWPSNLREAVGPGHGAQRTAAGFIGIFGQLFVATVGGALAVGLVAGTVALCKVAF